MGQMTRAPDQVAETDADSAADPSTGHPDVGGPEPALDAPSLEGADAPTPPESTRDDGEPSRAKAPFPWRDLIWLAMLRLATSAGVAMYGVVALSDDDYARVTIAQRFAARPRLDPSGTSWLPFPFWVMGAAMKALDSSLDVARVVTAALSVAATWLIFAAGRAWGLSHRSALVAAALATLMPATALLGSVTVPELPAAALALFAIVTVTAPGRGTAAHRAPLLAAATMLAATLSRYETWPVAAAIAVVVWRRQHADQPWKRMALSALPLLGPAIWIAHNRIANGDAFSFLRRVSSYRAALGPGQGDGPWTYLVALVGGSPAVMLGVLLLTVATLRLPNREAARRNLARFSGWGVSAALLLVFLLVGQLAGGAPTHHPERALLLVWLLATLAAVDLASQIRPKAWLAIPVVLLLVLDYASTFSDRGIRRENEERVGQQLRALVPRGERVFAATHDYGYFAIMSAWGRPGDVVVDSQDPRLKSNTTLLRDPWNAVVRMRAENVSWLVAPSTVVFPLALQERMRDGRLVIYELSSRR